MTFRAFKPKSKSTESNLPAIALSTLSETQTDDNCSSNIEKLQNEIEHTEKILNKSINHFFITLDANIDDIKVIIDQKRAEDKLYKISICDLWLRLKALEQMESISLATFLYRNRLHRPQKNLSEINDNLIESQLQYLTNPRRSRLIHFNICPESDVFNININSYVGLMIFSYDNQSKFKLNGHYSQCGDIIIKQINFFDHVQSTRRGIYDAIFKWYFNRSMDERFFGTGFLYINGKWRFDLLTYDHRELFAFEYRMLDMFMLTHWLTTTSIIPHNVQEMEINAKDLLIKQFEIVKIKLVEQKTTGELATHWNEISGEDINDLQLAIELFNETIEKEMEIIFKLSNIKKDILVQLLTQNT